MGGTLSGALDDARRLGFVGRATELAAFVAALDGSTPERVLFVHGPGGIGKSTLLDEMRRRAVARGRPVVSLDGRDVAGSIPAVAAAVATVDDDPGPVLLVDSYELLTPLDRWFRQELLPSLPAGAVAVLAGREPPGAAWSADAGWRRLLRGCELAALEPAESADLLGRFGAPERARARLAALGRGHPLALVLLAEAAARGRAPGRLDDLPDLVAALCHVLVRDVPDAAHRIGLATCAHAYRTTEDLLAETVGERAPEVWAWLASRPFVRHSGEGLHLHDLLRELLEAEFAQRNPEAYVSLHRTIRHYATSRLLEGRSPTPFRDATELMLLHRRSPLEPALRQLRDEGVLPVEPGRPADHAPVLEHLARTDGACTAELAGRWLAAQPESLYVARSDAGLEAWCQQLYVRDTSGPADPVVRAVLEAVDRHGPLRPEERIVMARFLGALPGPRYDAMRALVGSVSSIINWLTRPAAWTIVAAPDEPFWRPYMEYFGLSVLTRTDGITAYGWDRRRLPLAAFMRLAARRELSGESGAPPAALLLPPPLDRAAFADAVRAALRDLHRPDRLGASPLTGTALGPDVRDHLVAAVGRVGEEPKGEVLRRVLDRTYLRPAPSQEAAAEVLGLPFSTYRRHLGRAVERLVEVLWAVETGQEVSNVRSVG
jgi:AAA ATPase domain